MAEHGRTGVVARSNAALLISFLALVVALSAGTSYAAARIGTKDIKKGAVTSKKIKNGTIKPRDLAPATLAKMAQGPKGEKGDPGVTLWAVVSVGGALDRGSHVVSVERSSTGIYRVVFDRDVSKCAYVATPGNTGVGNPVHSTLGVAPVGGQPKGVFIDARDSLGDRVDRSFYLMVAC